MWPITVIAPFIEKMQFNTVPDKQKENTKLHTNTVHIVIIYFFTQTGTSLVLILFFCIKASTSTYSKAQRQTVKWTLKLGQYAQQSIQKKPK